MSAFENDNRKDTNDLKLPKEDVDQDRYPTGSIVVNFAGTAN
jgi:hypothetical protein